MDDQSRALLHNFGIKLAALHDAIVLLLAMEARSSGDPGRTFEEFSNGLDRRLNKSQSLGLKAEAAKEIRANLDTLIASARLAVGP